MSWKLSKQVSLVMYTPFIIVKRRYSIGEMRMSPLVGIKIWYHPFPSPHHQPCKKKAELRC